MRSGVALFAISLVLSGCANDAADPKMLKQAATAYNARQINDAERLAGVYIAAKQPGPNIDEAYYIRGLARFTNDDRPGAAADLRESLARTARPDLKAKAHRALGDMEFASSHWAQAQKHYEETLTESQAVGLPAPVLNAAALVDVNYHIGVCLQAQGMWAKSQPYLERAAATQDASLKETKDLAVARIHATHYALQYGAFKEATNANALVNQLKAAGITSTIDIQPRNGESMCLVVSGSYGNWADAAAAREKVLAKYPLVAIVP